MCVFLHRWSANMCVFAHHKEIASLTFTYFYQTFNNKERCTGFVCAKTNVKEGPIRLQYA